EFNAELCDFLATHPALFQKFSESFLCLVGISRYYDLDDNVYPVFLADDDEEIDLFAFIHHADPTKVQVRQRETKEGEVSLLELTRGRVVSLPDANDQGDANIQGVGDIC
nr:transposase (putative), gypsy type [Tanacetum cinerariifolium]